MHGSSSDAGRAAMAAGSWGTTSIAVDWSAVVSSRISVKVWSVAAFQIEVEPAMRLGGVVGFLDVNLFNGSFHV
uniref:Uncharacterized protein n=1 Tax=Romanomermis culicivorax TaxID=13658 RepID=A0A915JL52_ROMCU